MRLKILFYKNLKYYVSIFLNVFISLIISPYTDFSSFQLFVLVNLFDIVIKNLHLFYMLLKNKVFHKDISNDISLFRKIFN